MTHPARSLEVPGLAHNAPIPLGAKVGNLICSSGIGGKDPATGQLPPDAAAQARHAFDNMQRLLDAGGATLADVAKLTVYLKAPPGDRKRSPPPKGVSQPWGGPASDSDNSVREAINAEWLRAFPDAADRPARHILIQDLQHGMWLQLEFIALIQKAG
jgi:2-iminobutanoate/2-iminopropanoate deaminase